jgi:hypothetical protein
MSLRNNMYYWKCDSPHSTEEKKKLYFKEKYNNSDMEDIVRSACTDHVGSSPSEIKAAGCDGNHFAYIVTYPVRNYFFRADGGSGVLKIWPACQYHHGPTSLSWRRRLGATSYSPGRPTLR